MFRKLSVTRRNLASVNGGQNNQAPPPSSPCCFWPASLAIRHEVNTKPVKPANPGINVIVTHGGTPNSGDYGVSDADSDTMETTGLQDMQNVDAT
jgi:hypothetical protein